ncbi:DNA polymerase III subunit gamma and tau [Salininema proteolyticum]|uniref:DNA polymerase III subunit gamma/tau n=1 Tax=Salininema proteolyticum TaxID=1607685 RepID=A0ABV8U2C4_9ACTN
MALALYRKYRPQTFAEVVGQEHVTEPLMNALDNGRLNHAFLFSGPRGCGKTSSARILARSLNCENGPTANPCGECRSCRALATGGPGSVDVIEIDAASHGGVEDARELRERAVFAPAESRYKIYIIDEAHMVTAAGFNALLKLVEEPPEYVVFIFATTEPEKVLPTIRSRTHHYPFRLIAPPTMKELCERLCSEEDVTVSEDSFPLVVRAGGGSARDTLSILDQLIAGAGPEGVTYRLAADLLGVSDAALIDDMCEAFADSDGAAVMGVVERVVDAGHDARRYAQDLLERLRDLIVLTQVPDAEKHGLVQAPSEQLTRMKSQATRLGMATLTRMAEVVAEGIAKMRGATAPRLLLEIACARAVLPGSEDTMASLLQRIETVESRGPAAAYAPSAAPASVPAAPSSQRAPAAPSAPPVPAKPSVQPAPAASNAAPPAAAPTVPSADRAAPVAEAPAPTPSVQPESAPAAPEDPPAESPVAPEPDDGWNTPATAGEPAGDPPPPAEPAPVEAPPVATTPEPSADVAAVRRQWDRIMQAVKSRKRVTAFQLQEATVADVGGGELVLSFNNPFLAQKVSEDPAKTVVLESLAQVLGGTWKIRCEVGAAPQAAAPLPPPGPPAAVADAPMPDEAPPAPPWESGPEAPNPQGGNPTRGSTPPDNVGGAPSGDAPGPIRGASGAAPSASETQRAVSLITEAFDARPLNLST